jgi:hypothetical protein
MVHQGAATVCPLLLVKGGKLDKTYQITVPDDLDPVP